MKIKVKLFNPNCALEVLPQGDWIDLRASETVSFEGPKAHTMKRVRKGGLDTSYRNVTFDSKIIPLGVAMELPKGFEAVVNARSSTFKKFKLLIWNGQGVIDNHYNGDNDQWGFPAIAFADTVINAGERICQFRIQPNQKATMWQKLKWLFSSKIEIVYVDHLGNDNRNGFGSTGVK